MHLGVRDRPAIGAVGKRLQGRIGAVDLGGPESCQLVRRLQELRLDRVVPLRRSASENKGNVILGRRNAEPAPELRIVGGRLDHPFGRQEILLD